MAHDLSEVSDALDGALRSIDWQAPWLDGWRDIGEPLSARVQLGDTLFDALNLHATQVPCAQIVTFVPQSALPRDVAYEQFIFDTGQCPTRSNLHDFFNGLAWIRFPDTKRLLNRLQAHAIEASGINASRGTLRDAITVFDENGAFFDLDPSDQTAQLVWQALRRHDWATALVAHRSWWQSQTRIVLFGHALLEKLVNPRKSMVAHVLAGQVINRQSAKEDAIRSVDLSICACLNSALTTPKSLFQPLPVLGIPNWWVENADPQFYDDQHVFRPTRSSILIATNSMNSVTKG